MQRATSDWKSNQTIFHHPSPPSVRPPTTRPPSDAGRIVGGGLAVNHSRYQSSRLNPGIYVHIMYINYISRSVKFEFDILAANGCTKVDAGLGEIT